MSILGALPFTLMLPYASLVWTGVLTVVINLMMSSAFAAILIYAIEFLPGRIGLVGGFFYGLSFGLGGIAAASLRRRWARSPIVMASTPSTKPARSCPL